MIKANNIQSVFKPKSKL